MNGTINSTTIKNDNDKIIINKLWLSNVTFFENENENTTTAEKITSNIATTSSSSQNNNGEQIATLSHPLPLDSTFSKPECEHIEQKKEYIVAEIDNDKLIVINPNQEDANNVTTNLDVEIKNPKILKGEKILMTKDDRRICGIKNCYNTEGRKGDGSLLTLFRYPKNDPVLNNLWIKYTYDFLYDKNIPISDACTLICSEHFDQNDLQPDKRLKSLHNLKRYKLKKGAYPKIIQKTNAANQLMSEPSELNKSNMKTTRKRMSDSKQDLMEDEMTGVNSSISPAKKICLVNPEKSMTYKEQKSKSKIDELSTNSKISCQNEFLNNITIKKSKSLNNLQKPSIATLKPDIQNNQQELMSTDDFQSAILIDDSNMNLESEISASNNSNDRSKQIEKSGFSTSNNNYESRRIENKSDSELIKRYTIKILKLKKLLLEKNKMILEIKKNHSLEEYSRIKYQKQKEPDLTLHKKIVELMKKIKQLERDNRNITEKNQNEYKSLQNIFTNNQINILLGKTNKCNWTLKEILDANKLHSMSSDNVYMYLVKDLKYPLPSLSIIQYYLSMLNIDFFNNNGICKKNLEFMKLFANIKNDIERITVLSICEFKLEKLYFYNENTDEINDPKKCIQVILAYGLFSDWKQPIYMNHYDENNEINSNILCKLIKKLDKYGFNTVALVTNCRKRKIWKELNITIKKPYFEVDISHNDDNNQNTNENENTNTNSNYLNKTKMKNIYVLFDSSDLLRILRCWFLDSGFILKDKTAVTKELYEELIENYSNDVQLLYGFKKDHIKHNKRYHCKYYNNQDYEIKLSEDLMSDNAANALREFQYYEPNISEFFDTVDKWYKFVRNKNFRKTLYTNDEEQNSILNRMYSLIKGMRHAVRQKPLNYQKAILISIESLKRLYDTVCNYCSEISLDKLSLDSSKRFYNDLLLYGNCSGVTPSYIELPVILKRLLLTPVKNEQFLIDSKLLKLNTSIDNDEEYLSIIVLNHYNALQYPENLSPQSCDNLPPTSESEPSSSVSTLFYPSKEFKSKDITYGKNFISEDECFPYVIGWIVKNLKAHVPKLCANSQADFLHVPSQIIDGEIIRPSKWSVEIAKILEQDFISYHEKGLRRKAVVKGLIKKLIDKYKTIPDDVIKVFIHQRTLIRIQFLNMKLNSNTMKRRQKKMKKLQWKRKNTMIAENFIIDNNYDQIMLQTTYLPPASTNVLPPSTLSSQTIINPPTSQQIMSSEPITTTTTTAAAEDEIFPTMATLTNPYNDIIEEIISTETEYPIVDANQPMVLGLRDGLVIGSSVDDDYSIIVDR